MIIKKIINYITSFIFFLFFYAWTALVTIPLLPVIYLLPSITIYIARIWAFGLWLFFLLLCANKYKLTGRENISENTCIIASKHQAAWETFIFFLIFKHPVFILKKQLMNIPVFGSYLKKLNAIAVNRDGSLKDLKNVLEQSKKLYEKQKYQLIIFPEGTRVEYGKTKDLEVGIYMLYKNLDYSIYPLAHNSGKFWKKGKILKKAGTIEVKIFPKIEKGLKKEEFLAKVFKDINSVS